MTEREQQIAIAEACGWHGIEVFPGDHGLMGMLIPLRGFLPLPDYLHDLNAMRDAEKILNSRQCVEYDEQLHDLVTDLDGIFTKSQPERFVWHATTAQRAEAFLRTIAKWRD